ncbi:MFS transporter [Photobacterium sanctipauli]|uniref:MFS transporter n=1 Tax=Photobacterium sanctipauli TaxID=1342794 RepID=A0A2T3NNE7_9GAMM|nr:MFS transporter [Photobacterium sanctipauli]PSW17186.1 MFS transporter [Photobacterium sanctipauli]
MTEKVQAITKPYPLYILASIATLMGIGQNGLLVSLPLLIEYSAFSLPEWSMLIALGSFLFLPAAPYWGKRSDRRGPKPIVKIALMGMALSFFMLLGFSQLSHSFSDLYWVWLIGLIGARVIYGLTVAGLVPALQHWAILLCGEDNRMQAIGTISIGLSSGRLVGPLFCIAVLNISPYASLATMAVFPIIALLAAWALPAPEFTSNDSSRAAQSKGWLPPASLASYLLSGLFLCIVIALLQYTLPAILNDMTTWSSSEISNAIGLLLTLSAAVTLATQVIVIKKKRLSAAKMFRIGGVTLALGATLFLTGNLVFFAIGMAILSFGAALLVPAYTTLATQAHKHSPGATSGFIAMSHTVGYTLAAVLAYSVQIAPIFPIYICLAASVAILIISANKGAHFVTM